jgi:succinate dehydrogenase/fumarate reductase flavoprotein subunit
MEWSIDHVPAFILQPLMMKFLTTALAPSTTLFDQGAILVSERGERFCNELEKPALRLPDQPHKVGFIVIDAALAQQFSTWPNYISTAPGIAYAYIPDYRANRPDVYTQANTLNDLAKMLGMDIASLTESAKSGGVRKLGQGPYVALGPVRSVFVHNEGGLKVDTQHRVLGHHDQPIEGLYAAGSTGQGGLLLKGHGHHLAWAFVSGRRAGKFAANNFGH